MAPCRAPTDTRLGLAVATFLLLSSPLPRASAKCGRGRKQKPYLFVFGDSQVDVGTNNFLATDLKANLYPYGITRLPASGRFSNGLSIPDYVAAYMGIPSPVAFLSNNTKTCGVNFASGGSGILDSTNPTRSVVLSEQLRSFMGLRAAGKISDKVAAKALYLVSTGSNDLLRVPLNPTEAQVFLGQAVQSYFGFFQALYAAGARKFIRSDLAPLGCLPSVRALTGSGPSCNAGVNTVVQGFNTAVADALGSPHFVAVAPSARLVTFDLYAATEDVLNNLQKNGVDSLDACCGGPGAANGLVPCGRSRVINGQNLTYVLCSDIRRFLFWDSLHPTQRFNRRLARYLWKGPFTTPATGARALL